MPDLGNAYVNIIPKAPGIKSNIENILNEGGDGAENAGKSFGKRILGGITAAGIGAGAVSLIKQAFEAGGELQQSFGGLDTIYGDAADAAKDFAMQASAAGISANDYAEQAVAFGAALKKAYGGEAQPAMEAANLAILDMADNAAKMGTPLENIQNAYQGFAKQNYTMLDNLKLGYGGTKSEMERLLADAEAISGVHYDLDNLGDVYSAIHVIQEELGLSGVAAMEAETTFTGSLNSVKAAWTNVMAAMTTGENLETSMTNLSNSVSNFANNVFTMFGSLATQLPDLILGLAKVVIDNAPEFIKSGVEMIVQLGVGLIQALPDIIAMIPDIITGIWNAFAEVDWISLGVDIINGIISGIWEASGSLWRSMQDLAQSAWQSAKDFLGIGSPSKVFADKVGKWIPAGMAEGIDENVAPVTASVKKMSDQSLGDMQAYRPESTGSYGPDMQQLLDALHDMKFELYMDGRQITDVVTKRQRQNARAMA